MYIIWGGEGEEWERIKREGNGFDVGTGTWDLTTKQSLYTCWTTIPSTIKETPMFFCFF